MTARIIPFPRRKPLACDACDLVFEPREPVLCDTCREIGPVEHHRLRYRGLA